MSETSAIVTDQMMQTLIEDFKSLIQLARHNFQHFFFINTNLLQGDYLQSLTWRSTRIKLMQFSKRYQNRALQHVVNLQCHCDSTLDHCPQKFYHLVKLTWPPLLLKMNKWWIICQWHLENGIWWSHALQHCQLRNATLMQFQIGVLWNKVLAHYAKLNLR